jgi:hypothetical protein
MKKKTKTLKNTTQPPLTFPILHQQYSKMGRCDISAPTVTQLTCAFCDNTYKGRKSVKASLIRHIRNESTKPKRLRGKHPKEGSSKFAEVAERLGMKWRRPVDEVEKKTTRSKEQTKSHEKRKQVILARLEPEIARLRYYKLFYLLTCRELWNRGHFERELEEAPISKNPPFSELVCRYLTREEWTRNGRVESPWEVDLGKKKYRFNYMEPIETNAQPGPEAGIMDKQHYRALSKNKECDKTILKAAWKEWKRLGCYEFGENQRRYLASHAQFTLDHIIAIQALCRGTEGSMEEQEEYTSKLMLEGKAQSNERGKWITFKSCLILEAGWFDREQRCAEEREGVDPNTLLGQKVFDIAGNRI